MTNELTPTQALKHCDFVTGGLCDPAIVKPLYLKRRMDFGYTFGQLALMTRMHRGSLADLFKTERWVRPKTHIILCEALGLDPRTLDETRPAPDTGGIE